MQNKVAEITIYFWVLKIMATTLGETSGDMLSMTLDMGYVAGFAITGAILLALLFFQLRVERFHSPLFWAAIIGTTTAGTEISDMMDRTFHLGYFWGSVVLTAGLAATLYLWHRREKGLRVYPIDRRGPEIMFWIAVLFSNSLGTAFGDYLTDNLELSYIAGALVTSGVIGVVLALHYFTKINDVLLFWGAFIFTRPFGATFGDFLTKGAADGGLGLDRIESSAVILLLFAAVLYVSHKRHHVD